MRRDGAREGSREEQEMRVVKCCTRIKGCFYHEETQLKQKTNKGPNKAKDTPVGSSGKSSVSLKWVFRVGQERRILKRAAISPMSKDGPSGQSVVSAPCPSHLNMTRTLLLHRLLPAHLLFLSLMGLTPAYGIMTSCSFHRYRIAPSEDESYGGLGTHLCDLGRLRYWEYKTAGRLGIKTFM